MIKNGRKYSRKEEEESDLELGEDDKGGKGGHKWGDKGDNRQTNGDSDHDDNDGRDSDEDSEGSDDDSMDSGEQRDMEKGLVQRLSETTVQVSIRHICLHLKRLFL